MTCFTCPRFQALPTCLAELTVETFADNIGDDVDVVITNRTTSYSNIIEGSINGTGQLIINLPDVGFSGVPGHDYSIAVFSNETGNQLSFTVGDTSYNCARFTFELIHIGFDDLAEYATKTLTPIEP